MTAPERPGDRDQQQAAEVVEQTRYRGAVMLERKITKALAAARAEEAARWQAKIEALIERYVDGRDVGLADLRAVLDGEQQEHNLGVNGDWCLTHGEPYPHGDAS